MTSKAIKIDFKKEFKKLYHASARPSLVEVPAMNFLMIDGQGTPDNNPPFQNAIQALYSTSYTLKFSFKGETKPAGYFDYVVPPLEGLWWTNDNSSFDMTNGDKWRWTLMIMQPEYITTADIKNAIIEANAKNPDLCYNTLRFERYEEGLCTQLLHIGSYDTEGPNIIKMHEHALHLGYELHGKHHEIYLSDPRKSDPDKLRTILRQPIRKERKI